VEVALLFVILFGLIALRVPIAFALIASSLAILVGFLDTSPKLIASKLTGTLDDWVWVAVPLFILLGGVMGSTGVTRRLFDFAQAVVGHFWGGLSHVSVLTNTMLSGMSGSILADAAATGSIVAPSMRQAGYPPGYTAAIVGAGAIIGPLIPPSIIFIIIGTIGNISIMRLWLGGVVPGVMTAFALLVVGYWISRKKGFPHEPRASWGKRSRTFLIALPALFVPVIIVGGMRLGYVTPTEGGAIGIAYVLLLSFTMYREAKFKDFATVAIDTVKTSGNIFFLIASALTFSWVLSVAGTADAVVDTITSITESPLAFLFLVNVVFLFLGCIIEGTPLYLIFVPFLMPVVHSYGIHPVHFGVVFAYVILIGQLTPPMGLTMFLVCSITGADTTEYVRMGWPLLVALLLVLTLITLFPTLVLWLPTLVMG